MDPRRGAGAARPAGPRAGKMSDWNVALLLLIPAYLLGTFPSAVLVARAGGHDVTAEGSKNPGASNVARLMGWKAGLLVLARRLRQGRDRERRRARGRGSRRCLRARDRRRPRAHVPGDPSLQGREGRGDRGRDARRALPGDRRHPRGRLVPRGPRPQARVGRVAALRGAVPGAGRGRRLRRPRRSWRSRRSRSSSSPATRPTSGGWSRAASCGPGTTATPSRGDERVVNPGRIRVENSRVASSLTVPISAAFRRVRRPR